MTASAQQTASQASQTDRLVETLSRALADRTDVELAILFGSRARDRAQPDSDADVGVEAAGVDLLRLATELSLAAGVEVDVVDLREAGYPLLQAALRDCRLVHQGRRGAFGDWLSKTITVVELDRPWFERMREGFLKRLAESDG